jgi:hypothetical protein
MAEAVFDDACMGEVLLGEAGLICARFRKTDLTSAKSDLCKS